MSSSATPPLSPGDDGRRSRSLVLDVTSRLVACDDLTSLANALAKSSGDLFAADAEVRIARHAHAIAHSRVGEGPAANVEPLRAQYHSDAAQLDVELVLHASRSEIGRDAIGECARAMVDVAGGVARHLVLVAEARAFAAERQQIVAIASHDLRTPLQSLALGLDAVEMMLAGTTVATQCASTFARMHRGLAAMGRLLGDLLDLSRIHEGTLAVQVRSCSTSQLVRELAEQHAPLAAARGFAFQVQDEDAGSVLCDPTRLAQALSNLLGNAVRHASRGPIVLRAKRSGDVVRFEVEDGGPGIAPDVRTLLFDRLFRRSADASGRGGLGLGLYIAKGIVVAHRGAIGVESDEGTGSVFWIELKSPQ